MTGSIDAIKAAVPLVDVIGRYVKLTRRGREYIGLCPFHRDKTPSFTVPEGKGFYHCFGCGQHGDVFDFIMAIEGVHFTSARQRLAEIVGIPNAPIQGPDPVIIEACQRKEQEERRKRRACARAIWGDAISDCCRDLVRAYWRSRGLTIEPPPTIRSGRVWHCSERHTMPAMIAAIQNAEGRLQGVHLTFLRPDGLGKAQIERPRLIHGEMIGGAVRLAPAGPKLGIAEGIENAATVQQETDLPSWAALSACNLNRLELPAAVQEVVIIADRGETGEGAARRAVNTYRDRVVRIAWPPRDNEDFNAALQADRGRAGA
jgi:phage/plasmid primase-like uncharacterized protein